MGATFGAVVVRGASVEDATRAYAEALEAQGFRLLGEDEPEPPEGERRGLVWAQRGYAVVADEDVELSTDEGAALGADLAAWLHLPALYAAVFDSDELVLSLHDGRREIGNASLPRQSRLDRSGRRVADLSFLAAIATKGAELDAVRCDFTLIEETLALVGEAIGLGPLRKGARYAWGDAIEGARRLRFALPADDEHASSEAIDHGGMPAAIQSGLVDTLELQVGSPLRPECVAQVHAYGGPAFHGLEVVLSGDALSLLEIRGIDAWNPNLDDNQQIAIVRRPVEGRVARFPELSLAPQAQPIITGTSQAAMRAWTQKLRQEASKAFVYRLVGEATREGDATLEIELRTPAGVSIQRSSTRVIVARAPRVPITPALDAPPPDTSAYPPEMREAMERAARMRDPEEDRELALQRTMRDRVAYGGDDFVFGEIAFDGEWSSLREPLTATAIELAELMAAATGLERLAIQVTSAGTHPKAGAFQAKKPSLAQALPHLDREAVVRIETPFDSSLRGVVQLAHEPHGASVFTEALRASLPPIARAVPIWIAFAFPRNARLPRDTRDRLDAIARCFLRLPGCLALTMAPTGMEPSALHTQSLPFEGLSGVGVVRDWAEWVARHPRSPGFRVLVPRGCPARPAPMPGVAIEETPAGLLLAVEVGEDLAMSDAHREAIERACLPCFGTQAEAFALFERHRAPKH